MTLRSHGWKLLLVGTMVAASGAMTATAQASTSHVKGAIAGPAPKSAGSRTSALPMVFHGPAGIGRVSLHGAPVSFAHSAYKHGLSKGAKSRYATTGTGSGLSWGASDGPHLQCVTFARAASGIELRGNAADWWYAASGVYARGEQPEAGSVLNFRGTGRMRLGHVAVVTNVVGARQIEIDHANWPGGTKGNVSRGVPVIDVSPDNDWSEVRVGLGTTGGFGSTYPTYGFIYDRPDNGTMVAGGERRRTFNTAYVNTASYDEVAEAPSVRRVSTRAHRSSGGSAGHKTSRARQR